MARRFPSVLKKPRAWAVNGTRVGPEWKWFWKSRPFVLPIWEGGAVPFDKGHRRQPMLLIGTPTWQMGHAGRGMLLSDDSMIGTVSPYLDISGWTEMSYFTYGEPSSYPGNYGFWRSQGQAGFFIQSGTGTGLRLQMNGTGLFNVTTSTLPIGVPTSYAYSTKSGNNKGYVNGLEDASSTTTYTWPTGTEAQIWKFGLNQLPVPGVWHLYYIAEDFWTAAQHAQLAADPFGPIRMVDEVGVLPVAAVATGAGAGSLMLSGVGF